MNLSNLKSANEQIDSEMHSDCEQFRKEKAAIPTELRGEVQQECRYLRQDYRYELLHALLEDKKRYSYERYENAEKFVDRALQDERIHPEKRPEVIEQEQHEAEK